MELKNKKRTFIDSIYNCIEGIITVYKIENNFRREIIMGLLTIIMGFILKIDYYEWIMVLILIGLVLGCELINTALEKTVDLYTDKYSEIGKIIKDSAGGAVLIMSITSFIVGIIIFIPKIIERMIL